MRFKPEVSIKNLTTQLLLAMIVVESVYTNVFRMAPPLFTSLDDGDHGVKGVPDEKDKKTLHGKGKAFDVRTKTVPRRVLPNLAQTLELRLGPLGFDVILEGRDTDNEHIHIEYDPKKA
jgi:hypothetical protein